MKLLNNKCNKGSIVYLGDIKDSFVNIEDKVYKTSRYKLNLELQNNYLQKNKRYRELVLNVTLKKDTEVLDEVVVTALGIKKEAKALTYNV